MTVPVVSISVLERPTWKSNLEQTSEHAQKMGVGLSNDMILGLLSIVNLLF